MEQINAEKLYKEIEIVKRLVIAMKEEMEDRFLTAQEEKYLDEARKELECNQCISLEDLEKELNGN